MGGGFEGVLFGCGGDGGRGGRGEGWKGTGKTGSWCNIIQILRLGPLLSNTPPNINHGLAASCLSVTEKGAEENIRTCPSSSSSCRFQPPHPFASYPPNPDLRVRSKQKQILPPPETIRSSIIQLPPAPVPLPGLSSSPPKIGFMWDESRLVSSCLPPLWYPRQTKKKKSKNNVPEKNRPKKLS